MVFRFGKLAIALAVVGVSSTCAFTVVTPYAATKYNINNIGSNHGVSLRERLVALRMSADGNEEDALDRVRVPLSYDEMVADAASAVTDAFAAGITRQTVRILLPRDPSNANLGIMYEDDASTGRYSDCVLVPPDETWQGGIMQLYRAAFPTAVDIMKSLGGATQGGVPPRVFEDRSVDESGVDGCGLLMIVDKNTKAQETQEEERQIRVLLQPTQEIVNDGVVDDTCREAGPDRLVVLLNPQWRNIDDALDTASQNKGLFGNLASFLGGKGGVLNKLNDLGFQNNVFAIEGYVCKGGNIRLVKRFDSDWVIYAENDSLTDFIRVGTSKLRPTYQDCDKMLDDKGISLKYARDIGLAPKFEK